MTLTAPTLPPPPKNTPPLTIVIIGLAITSSWGNGHATTYRGLVRELSRRGHRVTFLEADRPWYAENRDLPNPPYGTTHLYKTTAELQARFADTVRSADLVIVGSYVLDGIAVGEWVTQLAREGGGTTAFYDIDTPVTLAKLESNTCDYLSPALIAQYTLYLSFTGGPTLTHLEHHYGSPRALPLYCSVDPELYFPDPQDIDWDLGYLGTYSDDRQPTVERLLLTPARLSPRDRFICAGPQYPDSIDWPVNVNREIHLAPALHRAFYNAQRFTLNVTRKDMIKAGFSPSVRLFEAAACGTPIISDTWPGLDTFFSPDEEILLAHRPQDVLHYLHDLPEADRIRLGNAARQKVLSAHTAAHRAAELEHYALTHPRP